LIDKKFSFEIKGNLKNIALCPSFFCSRISSILMGKEIRTCKLTKSHFPILWKGKEDLLANKTFFWSWENLSYFETIDFSKSPFSLKAFPILMGKEKGSSQVPSFNFMEKVFCMKA
jgi:hypothetical protein